MAKLLNQKQQDYWINDVAERQVYYDIMKATKTALGQAYINRLNIENLNTELIQLKKEIKKLKKEIKHGENTQRNKI
jgi:hypothetical protein